MPRQEPLLEASFSHGRRPLCCHRDRHRYPLHSLPSSRQPLSCATNRTFQVFCTDLLHLTTSFAEGHWFVHQFDLETSTSSKTTLSSCDTEACFASTAVSTSLSGLDSFCPLTPVSPVRSRQCDSTLAFARPVFSLLRKPSCQTRLVMALLLDPQRLSRLFLVLFPVIDQLR